MFSQQEKESFRGFSFFILPALGLVKIACDARFVGSYLTDDGNGLEISMLFYQAKNSGLELNQDAHLFRVLTGHPDFRRFSETQVQDDKWTIRFIFGIPERHKQDFITLAIGDPSRVEVAIRQLSPEFEQLMRDNVHYIYEQMSLPAGEKNLFGPNPETSN